MCLLNRSPYWKIKKKCENLVKFSLPECVCKLFLTLSAIKIRRPKIGQIRHTGNELNSNHK